MFFGCAGDDVAHLLGITAAGAITSLLFAAKAAATFIPKPAPTDAAPAAAALDPAAAAEEETAKRNAGLAVAALAAFAPLALTKHNPAEFGHMMTIPAGLAWSVLGWLVAKDWKAGGVPGSFLLTPMVAGALSANLGVMWHGKLAGVDYVTAMHNYLGQVRPDARICTEHQPSVSCIVGTGNEAYVQLTVLLVCLLLPLPTSRALNDDLMSAALLSRAHAGHGCW